ncbi:ABC transporter permease [Actinospica sp. MGRD01-02]|uniref:ABC transporter permease n=1 Tax=Actinospica acidithermotolerans TaxID=2828514 RepID=A0A941EH35_9ACTN|nr:ABC transporter permease [Actinospica acidithermotolerans]MBR7828954.1 ABC transporter permease [Actinospica acidithermotolerans]
MTLGRLIRMLWPPVLLAAVLIGGWQLVAEYAIKNPEVLPTPSQIVSAGWGQRRAIAHNAWPTLRETELGFAFSFVLAWVLATAMDFSPAARRAVYPLLVASQTVPIIAIAPLFVVMFGFGIGPKILLVALATFFPLAASLAAGFANADADADRLMRSMGASRWRIFWTMRVPGALPFFFTGLRVAITYAIGGAIFAEYAGAESGLGIYLQQMQQVFRTDLVFATVAVIAIGSVALFTLTYLLERWLTPWRKHERAGREVVR